MPVLVDTTVADLLRQEDEEETKRAQDKANINNNPGKFTTVDGNSAK